MSEIEIEAKTVEEAIQEGLRTLGITRDKVEIKILNEGTSGLFGLMGTKPARVRIMTKATPSGEEAEPGSDLALAQSRLKELLTNLLKQMNVGFKEIDTALMAGRIYADIKSDESSVIIGKNGQTLESLEHIVNLMLCRDPLTRVKATIDTEKYRQKQEERLQVMAHKAADQVKSSGKAYRFDPMPSKDRKIIHLTLKEDPDIETFSEGDGPFRKVGVKPRSK